MSEETTCYLLGGSDPIELRESGTLSIGRNPSNKLVVPDAHVSRNHAEIYHDGSNFVIADLNSSRGTMVNGASVNTHVLKDGDVIVVGQYSYTFREVAGQEELRAAMRAARKLAAVQSTIDLGDSTEMADPEKDFSGSLAAMPVKTLCRMLLADERSGILVVDPKVGGKVKIYLSNGLIRRAEAPRCEGDEAVDEALAATEGTFAFQASTIPITPNVQQDTRAILGMEG